MPSRRAVGAARIAYVLLVATQGVTLLLYQLELIPNGAALVVGLVTSLAGPFLSFLVSVRLFRHRRSRAFALASVALGYACTCISFAILYLILARHDDRAFTLSSSQPGFGLATALYFSVVTITTTGYGDVSPLSGLARLVACWEILTGLLYQVCVFSLVAALFVVPDAYPASRGDDPKR